MRHRLTTGVRIAPPAPPAASTKRAERKDNMRLKCTAALAVLVVATIAGPAAAQSGQLAAVTVPIEGRFARGGEFAGTATVNRFEQRDNSIVAVGVVTGTLRRGGRSVGSVVAWQMTWPVVLRVKGEVVARGRASTPGGLLPAHFALAQTDTCPVVQVGLSAIDANLLGVAVALSPMALDLSGDTAAPLGALVCSAADLLGNVAGLVNLLNSILGLLTGLLGGLTGLAGGVTP
jgi:hypothetical protein